MTYGKEKKIEHSDIHIEVRVSSIKDKVRRLHLKIFLANKTQ